jgi:hypothetical protein
LAAVDGATAAAEPLTPAAAAVDAVSSPTGAGTAAATVVNDQESGDPPDADDGRQAARAAA